MEDAPTRRDWVRGLLREKVSYEENPSPNLNALTRLYGPLPQGERAQ